eukprot:jgi/Chrzof1/2965/Cz12g06090.t1
MAQQEEGTIPEQAVEEVATGAALEPASQLAELRCQIEAEAARKVAAEAEAERIRMTMDKLRLDQAALLDKVAELQLMVTQFQEGLRPSAAAEAPVVLEGAGAAAQDHPLEHADEQQQEEEEEQAVIEPSSSSGGVATPAAGEDLPWTASVQELPLAAEPQEQEEEEEEEQQQQGHVPPVHRWDSASEAHARHAAVCPADEQQEEEAAAPAAAIGSSILGAAVGVAGCTALVAVGATVCGGVVAAIAAERAYSGMKWLIWGSPKK